MNVSFKTLCNSSSFSVVLCVIDLTQRLTEIKQRTTENERTFNLYLIILIKLILRQHFFYQFSKLGIAYK